MVKIKKIFSLVLMVCIMTVTLVGCGSNKMVLNVYNWGDYIDESVLDDFEKETGIKVNYETFATNEDMYVKIKSGGTNYDVAIPSDYMISKMIKEDLLQPIDLNNITNFNLIGDEYKNLDFDADNKYSVPYMWGTLGVIYNTTMVDEKVDSWNILWDEKYADEILMVNSQRDSIGITLKKLGYSINSTDENELNMAKEELLKQKPLVLAYVGDEVKDMMVAEEAAIAVVWSGDAVTMMEQNPNLKYVVPKEGSNKWFDNMVIPKISEHKEEAEKFIDFMTKAETSLKNVDYIGYSTPNTKTFDMLDDEIKNDETAYPLEKTLENCEVLIDIGDSIKLYDKIWTEILAN
ncbi:ABC transporter substrate-binding protein [Clostridium grantii]|uniref:Spermidine/putrescine transport system substrate-binding protein n=1 Tax=Clostridium grantii DSM 8605 TaxID=1121316 RepID=A0A1M5WLU3_9CLOT|nr:spermidine/putrescine ABC transporter substrate-binding protein [Clostridium grantii]SHH88392.1 spermidine/putrescine transport system substrate-binding protein [Clostridium grantii DSM 8605]